MMNYQEMSDEQIELAVSDAMNIPRGVKWCSDWSLAGQLAEENHIGVKYFLGEWMGLSTHPTNFATGFTSNPRRAICIVFLMMKGGE
ncbi:hypothetical protein [Rosenbergiella nectarea]|nr:hypothetical protein [Rosenbergiella nectarea]